MELRERKKAREFSIDEMMTMINHRFITGSETDVLNYAIASTTWKGGEKALIVMDSRDEYDQENNINEDQKLKAYYGPTIKEAVSKCFNDRANHIIYAKDTDSPWTK